MSTDKKNAGNTAPRWFVREQKLAHERLLATYGEASVQPRFRILGEDVVIEQYVCMEADGKFVLVNIEINRVMDTPFHNVYRQTPIGGGGLEVMKKAAENILSSSENEKEAAYDDGNNEKGPTITGQD